MFDVEGARKSGYSDAEIADHLSQKSGFDIQGARKSGYSDADLVKHLSVKQAKATDDIWSKLPSGVTGVARGVKDVLDTGAELASRAFGSKEEAARVKDMNRVGDAEFDARFGDSTAASVGRFGGNVLGTLPVGGVLAAPFRGAAAIAPKSADVLTRLATAVETGGLGGMKGGSVAANTAMRVGGGAATGGTAAGLIDPDSAGVGAAIGGALPTAVRPLAAAGNTIGQGIRLLTKGGQQSIADDVIRGAAAAPDDVAAKLATAEPSIAKPTFVEVADDPGIAALFRKMQNKSQDFASDYALRKSAQNSERFNAAYGLGGGDEGVAALRKAREEATDPLLALARQNAGEVGTMGIRGAAKEIAASPAWQRKAVRSSVSAAVEPFKTQTDEGAKWARKLGFEQAWGARQNIDDILYGSHGKVEGRTAKAAAVQLGSLRERLSGALNRASPDFAKYSKAYSEHSSKIDAAELLNDLVKKGTTGATDMNQLPIMSGPKLANALKGLSTDDWAKLTPDQQAKVHQLVRELERSTRAETLGKAVGSNTAQNLQQAMEMPWLLDSALRLSGTPQSGLGGVIGDLAGKALGSGRDRVYDRLGQLLLNPELAALAYQKKAQSLGLLGGLGQMSPALPGLVGSGSAALVPNRQ